ncbi:hypothetical protein L218DRAFT_847183, partial [Marasmius fiardii PR-910]
KLRKELDEVWPDIDMNVKYEELAVFASLRLSYGVTLPVPRRVGQKEEFVTGSTILPGTVVSCTAYIVHMNSGLFPEPHEFIPECWLGENSRTLEKYLVVFLKRP